uniref:hypothetical protein n=1 Tax=Trichocoleus desertorum TaxID=1481672 RepID=UPI0025B5F4D2|nr:hypothetical protein [Trichocoleus desertorum]
MSLDFLPLGCSQPNSPACLLHWIEMVLSQCQEPQKLSITLAHKHITTHCGDYFLADELWHTRHLLQQKYHLVIWVGQRLYATTDRSQP